jgi:hypothetical protein
MVADDIWIQALFIEKVNADSLRFSPDMESDKKG